MICGMIFYSYQIVHFVKTDSNSIDYEEDINFNLYLNFAAVSVGDRAWKSQPRELESDSKLDS